MKKNYESPVVKNVTVEIEKGFASSADAGTGTGASIQGFGAWESGVGL